MPTITVNGRTLNYEDVGQGTVVLLLHGFPLAAQSFKPQLDFAWRNARVIVPDLRGFGASSPGEGPSTMEAMAADCLTLLDALGIERAVVGGVSMGGYVALALTRENPMRVQGLVLIDTQATADDEAGKARREAVAVEVETQGVTALVHAMLPKLLAPTASPELRQSVETVMLAQSPRAVAAASRGMARRSDARELLARFEGPCLVVVGELDVITPIDKARAMASLVKGARLEVLAGAGHLSNLEKPGEFNVLLDAFASQFSGRG